MADRRLQVFHTVARMLSFTRAAEVLQMTQPAVTFQVRQLEEQFNVRLFDRSHNRIDLTEAGKRAYQHAERIFGLYGEMENAIREVTGDVSGLLRIGASTAIAQYSLPSILANFQTQYPQVQIQMKVAPNSAVVNLIENSFVDIGVVETTIDSKKLVVKPFCRQEMVLVVPKGHELANKEGVQIEDLASYAWIIREEGSTTREAILQYLANNGCKLQDMKIAMELGCPEAIKSAVETGSGISILPREAMAKEAQLGSLVAVRLDPTFARSISFVYKEQKFPLRAVDELLKCAFAQNSSTSYLPTAERAIAQ